MNDMWKLAVPFILFPIILLGIATLPRVVGAQDTGVCIFKGAPIYSTGIFGGAQSSGIPLRGIGVEAWHPGGFVGHVTDAAGQTDRTGHKSVNTTWQHYSHKAKPEVMSAASQTLEDKFEGL